MSVADTGGTGSRVLRLLRLRFHDEHLEQAFRSDYAQRLRMQSRVALLLGAVLYLLLGFEDRWFFPGDAARITAIRVVVAISLLSACGLTFSRCFIRFNQPLLLSQFLIAGGGALVMISLASLQTANSYYVGFLLSIVWAYSFSGLRFYAALSGNIVLLGAYALVLAGLKQTPPLWLLTNIGNLCAGSVIVAFGGYVIEWQRRMMFHQNLIIEHERRDHEQLALYDRLTGLPNRLMMERRLAGALHLAQRRRTRLAVLFVDIDHLKPVNDSFGHHAGDKVLNALAARIRGAVRQHDTVARIGGDEFLILIEDIRDRTDVSVIAQKILHSVQKPFSLRDGVTEVPPVRMSASVGAAVYPDDASNAEELIRRADAAMYQVKSNGRNSMRFYASYDRVGNG